LQEDLTEDVRPALLLLTGAIALVLLIVCANISNLLLSRASSRKKEIAVRIALGAGPWRITRQMLTESILLAIVGGALGIALAEVSLRLLRLQIYSINSQVLLFSFALACGTGILFGLAPALQFRRPEPALDIKSGAVSGGGAGNFRNALAVLEFALALVLVVGAAILAKSFVRLLHVDLGFNPQGVITMHVLVPPSRQPELLFHRIEESIKSLAGVEAVSCTNALPLIASRSNATRFNVPGSPLINPDALPAAQLRLVSPEYFAGMNIAIKQGRAFTDQDLTLPNVVINQTMAERFWPGRNVIGTKFITNPWAPTPSWSTIIGVVADVKQFGLDSEPSLDLYCPSVGSAYIVVKTSGDPSLLAVPLRQRIAAVDSTLAVSQLLTMNQIVKQSAKSRRTLMALLVSFACSALVLALIGIYGVMSWTVTQRTREIGIRMALGAESGTVLRMVVSQALKLCLLGIVVGLAATLGLSKVLAHFAPNVSAADPYVHVPVILSMAFAAALAAYMPAKRASRVDPINALRCD
jgi:putative ABC transport system permease protein